MATTTMTFPKAHDELEGVVFRAAQKGGKALLVKAAALCAEIAGAPEDWREAAAKWLKTQSATDAQRARDMHDAEYGQNRPAEERRPINMGTKSGRALLLACAAQDDLVSGRKAAQIAAAYTVDAARCAVRTIYAQHCHEKAQHVQYGGPERAQAIVAAKIEALAS